jgi:hypothetical protein
MFREAIAGRLVVKRSWMHIGNWVRWKEVG